MMSNATDYILRSARLLERRRFDHLFGTGSAQSVLDALAPYRNDDGGYGNALEPDGRGPGSQPFAVLFALTVLGEAGGTPDGVADYLRSISGPAGGVPFVHPNARDYPRAPWWTVDEDAPESLLPTANLAGMLHKAGVEHAWLTLATDFCWQRLDGLTRTHPYEALGAVTFLDNVPDRERAEKVAAQLGELVRAGGLVTFGHDGESVPEGYTEGEVHYPHDYAPHPQSLARQWFSDDEFDAGLDTLARAQREDGSWPVRWAIWTPATACEWGGILTVEALKTLRDYGRL